MATDSMGSAVHRHPGSACAPESQACAGPPSPSIRVADLTMEWDYAAGMRAVGT